MAFDDLFVDEAEGAEPATFREDPITGEKKWFTVSQYEARKAQATKGGTVPPREEPGILERAKKGLRSFFFGVPKAEESAKPAESPSPAPAAASKTREKFAPGKQAKTPAVQKKTVAPKPTVAVQGNVADLAKPGAPDPKAAVRTLDVPGVDSTAQEPEDLVARVRQNMKQLEPDQPNAGPERREDRSGKTGSKERELLPEQEAAARYYRGELGIDEEGTPITGTDAGPYIGGIERRRRAEQTRAQDLKTELGVQNAIKDINLKEAVDNYRKETDLNRKKAMWDTIIGNLGKITSGAIGLWGLPKPPNLPGSKQIASALGIDGIPGVPFSREIGRAVGVHKDVLPPAPFAGAVSKMLGKSVPFAPEIPLVPGGKQIGEQLRHPTIPASPFEGAIKKAIGPHGIPDLPGSDALLKKAGVTIPSPIIEPGLDVARYYDYKPTFDEKEANAIAKNVYGMDERRIAGLSDDEKERLVNVYKMESAAAKDESRERGEAAKGLLTVRPYGTETSAEQGVRKSSGTAGAFGGNQGGKPIPSTPIVKGESESDVWKNNMDKMNAAANRGMFNPAKANSKKMMMAIADQSKFDSTVAGAMWDLAEADTKSKDPVKIHKRIAYYKNIISGAPAESGPAYNLWEKELSRLQQAGINIGRPKGHIMTPKAPGYQGGAQPAAKQKMRPTVGETPEKVN